MNGLSPWAISANYDLADPAQSLYTHTSGNFKFDIYRSKDSIWIKVDSPAGGTIAFRALYCPGECNILRQTKSKPSKGSGGNLEYQIPGDSQIRIEL